MKKFIIMRGVPGSGKTTRAMELAGLKGRIHSADYFFAGEGGNYRFDRGHIEEAHIFCFEMVRASMEMARPLIILDSCNIQRKHFRGYLDIARQYGYVVEEVAMLPHPDPAIAAMRNVHGVSQESIERAIALWEP
ncbi:MAG: AAA family ATPase [Patescibacteria group bacterium]